MNLNQIKIGPRLALGFGNVVLLMAALVALATVRMEHFDNDVAEMVKLQPRGALAAEWQSQVHLTDVIGEISAAAAESLREQARRLSGLVGTFRLRAA